MKLKKALCIVLSLLRELIVQSFFFFFLEIATSGFVVFVSVTVFFPVTDSFLYFVPCAILLCGCITLFTLLVGVVTGFFLVSCALAENTATLKKKANNGMIF